MSDDLIKRLRDGVVEHDKRWSGDTHDDLGGSANYKATEAIMSEAATALAEAQTTIARMEDALESVAAGPILGEPMARWINHMMVKTRAALTDKPDAGEGE